jgi:hypothetical protein
LGHIAAAIGVLVVPADVHRDMKVRSRERTAERLDCRRRCTGAQRVIEACDEELACCRDRAAATEQTLAQHAVRGALRLQRRHVRRRAVGVLRIEDRVVALGQQELQLDVDRPDAPAHLRQMARLAGAAVRPLRHMEWVRQIDEAGSAEGGSGARAVEEGEVVRQSTLEEVAEAVCLCAHGPQRCERAERH